MHTSKHLFVNKHSHLVLKMNMVVGFWNTFFGSPCFGTLCFGTLCFGHFVLGHFVLVHFVLGHFILYTFWDMFFWGTFVDTFKGHCLDYFVITSLHNLEIFLIAGNFTSQAGTYFRLAI